VANPFGYATVEVLGLSEVQPGRSIFYEGSACRIRVSFFDDTDAPIIPKAVSYSITDVKSGTVVVPWVAVTTGLAAQMDFVLASNQNMMVSANSFFERRQVLVQIIDPTDNNIYYENGSFMLKQQQPSLASLNTPTIDSSSTTVDEDITP
jgi:hypothetical protein